MRTVTHINEGREYLLIGNLHPDAYLIELNGVGTVLGYETSELYDTVEIALDHGQWKLLGKASELTEEQAAETVHKAGPVFRDYVHDDQYFTPKGFRPIVKLAFKSLESLCESHGLTPDQTVILQKL